MGRCEKKVQFQKVDKVCWQLISYLRHSILHGVYFLPIYCTYGTFRCFFQMILYRCRTYGTFFCLVYIFYPDIVPTALLVSTYISCFPAQISFCLKINYSSIDYKHLVRMKYGQKKLTLHFNSSRRDEILHEINKDAVPIAL